MSTQAYAVLSVVLANLAAVLLGLLLVWALWRTARNVGEPTPIEAPTRLDGESVWQARVRTYLQGAGAHLDVITLAQLAERIGLSPYAAGTAEITSIVDTLYALDWEPFQAPCAETQGWAWSWRRPHSEALSQGGEHP